MDVNEPHTPQRLDPIAYLRCTASRTELALLSHFALLFLNLSKDVADKRLYYHDSASVSTSCIILELVTWLASGNAAGGRQRQALCSNITPTG